MKKFIKNTFNTGKYPNNVSLALLLIRLTAGTFMLSHGMGKFWKLFGDEPIAFADPIGVGVTASLALTVFAEVLCSLFLILGIATRLSAIPLLITMLVAAFIIHSDDPFGKKELALLYGVAYLVLLIAGAGKYSIDNFISKK